jgi:hypothetical protein
LELLKFDEQRQGLSWRATLRFAALGASSAIPGCLGSDSDDTPDESSRFAGLSAFTTDGEELCIQCDDRFGVGSSPAFGNETAVFETATDRIVAVSSQ